jgi:acetyl esterase/lipase
MPEGPAPIPADDPARDRGLPLPSAASVFSPWADLTLSGTTATTKADLDVAVTATTCGPAGPSTSAQRTSSRRVPVPSDRRSR